MEINDIPYARSNLENMIKWYDENPLKRKDRNALAKKHSDLYSL